MEMGWALNILGVVLNIVALIWAFFQHRQNEKLRELILDEKTMIRDRILDMQQTLQSYYDRVLADRKRLEDPALNTAGIRIEDLEGMIKNLQRFADSLAKAE
jgi:hypothetical protein